MEKAMKHAICCISWDRPEFTKQTWAANLDPLRWGRDAEGVQILWVDNGSTTDNFTEFTKQMMRHRPAYSELLSENSGIAYAVNRMLRVAFVELGCDFVTTMGSDIIEPLGWLGLRERAFRTIPNTALCSIKVSDAATLPIRRTYDDIDIELGPLISGNHTISRSTWEKFGYYYEPLGIYGPIDFEYCARIHYHNGPLSYQIASQRAEHLGTRGRNPKTYQDIKDASDAKAWPLLHQRVREMNADNLYYQPNLI